MTNTIGAQSRILLSALDISVRHDGQLSGNIRRAREVVECLLSDSAGPRRRTPPSRAPRR